MRSSWPTDFLIDDEDPMLHVIESTRCEGTYGSSATSVRVDPNNNEHYMVKELNSYISDKRKYLKFIQTISSLDNGYITRFIGYTLQSEGRPMKLVSKMEKNTLRGLINSNKLKVTEKNKIFKGISYGLCYLHDNGIVHGHLTVDNILVTEDSEARITDVGLKSLFVQPSEPIPTMKDDISSIIDILKLLMASGEQCSYDDNIFMNILINCENESEKRQYNIHTILEVAASLAVLTIYVKLPESFNYTFLKFDIADTATFYELKKSINDYTKNEIKINRMKLIYVGSIMEDHSTLKDMCVCNEATIYLLLKDEIEEEKTFTVSCSNEVIKTKIKDFKGKTTIQQIKEAFKDEIPIPSGMYKLQTSYGDCYQKKYVDIDDNEEIENISMTKLNIREVSPSMRVECIDNKSQVYYTNFHLYDTMTKAYDFFTKILNLSFERFRLAVDGREIPLPFEIIRYGEIVDKKQFMNDYNVHDGSKFTIISLTPLSAPTMTIYLKRIFKSIETPVQVSPDYKVHDLYFFPELILENDLHLNFNNQFLDKFSDLTLGSLGIEEGSKLQISRRLRGGKPVIYLYHDQESPIDVKVKISMDVKDGQITSRYPVISPKDDQTENYWKVTVNKEGEIFYNGRKHYYLFWECLFEKSFQIKEGFVIKGEKCFEFFEEKLSYLGLNEREANDFITYWCPQMENSKFVLIAFQGEQYTSRAPLIIDPSPEKVHRIFMTFKLIDKELNIPAQDLSPFRLESRNGFFVLEWGGAMIY